MSFNLLETVKGFFSGNLVSSAASSLGESEGGIQKAVSGAIPAVLAGLISKAGSTEGAGGILDLARQAAGSGILNNLSGFSGSDNSNLISKGAEMLKGVFGDRAGGIASLVSNFAGIKHSSASSLLSMTAPVALSVLGKHASDNNLGAGGLMSFLASQKNTVMNALPSGLSSVAGLLGLGSVGNNISSATGKATESVHKQAHYAADATEKTGGGLKFLLPLLLAVLAVALAIYLFKGCGTGTREEVATMDTTTAKITNAPDTAVATVVNNARELFKVKLPNDTVIDAYKGGIEDKLVTFLGTDYQKLGEDSLKKVWFDFDNLNFKTGSAVLTDESQQQVDNIAAILKAFPAVKLKIGGYTDKVGDEANNKKLSEARAKSVQAALSKAGVGNQITAAEGYGSMYAVYAANAPESDRVKDRHVSVSVR
jgi:outer membrane protein OmpA-like peptidoglycan-associated protein